MNVLTILTEAGVLKPEDAKAIEAEALATQAPVETLLEKRGITSQHILAKESEKYGIPMRSVPATARGRGILDHIPEESARHYGFVPLAVMDGALEVGIVDPDNIEALDALQFISSRVGLPYKLFLISRGDFNRVIDEYGSLSDEVGTALSELEPAAETEGLVGEGGTVETIIKEDAPVTKIVATILRYAVEGGASDIHVEPGVDKTHVRFRMDGDLHTSLELPVKVHPAVVA